MILTLGYRINKRREKLICDIQYFIKYGSLIALTKSVIIR